MENFAALGEGVGRDVFQELCVLRDVGEQVEKIHADGNSQSDAQAVLQKRRNAEAEQRDFEREQEIGEEQTKLMGDFFIEQVILALDIADEAGDSAFISDGE